MKLVGKMFQVEVYPFNGRGHMCVVCVVVRCLKQRYSDKGWGGVQGPHRGSMRLD